MFINCPFDSRYEPLFLAQLASIIAFGRRPRCVVELPTSAARLERLMEIIDSCDASFHDLSRVQGTRTRSHGTLPRFNMPFELGLSMVRSIEKRQHVFIFEEVPHRLHATTSDVAMFDPLIHRGTVEGVLSGVLDALGTNARAAPSIQGLREMTRRLRREMNAAKRDHGKSTVFNRTMFRHAIGVSTLLARQLGILD
ncbi:MAG: hypothetical protein ACK4N5_01595 [Myxococcales bacterium]